MNSRCFKPYRAYSVSFDLSNVGKFLWSRILKDCIKVQEKKKENDCFVFPSSTKLEIRDFRVVVVQRRANLSFCQSGPVAFLPFLLPSPLSLFKVMLHRTIGNDGFSCNTALQCWNNVGTMLEQCCNHSKQCRNNVATLCCTKNRRCESSRVTSAP